jgi:hypothetical protein
VDQLGIRALGPTPRGWRTLIVKESGIGETGQETCRNGTWEMPMPFKSQAQRRKFAQLLVEGKISDQTYEEWNRETGSRKLPERIGAKSRVSPKGTSARKRRTAKKR